jgi:signal transduction histidine kinase
LIDEVPTHQEMGSMTNAGAELSARQIATDERWKVSVSGSAGAAIAAAPAEPIGLRGRHRGVLSTAAGRATLLTAVAVLALLPLLAIAPTLKAPALESTIETTMTCGAFAAAWLMRARFADSRSMRDLLAAAAVGTLGLMNLCDRVLPATLSAHAGTPFLAAQLLGQVVVAAVFAAAAFTPSGRMVSRPHRFAALAVAAAIAAAATVTMAGFLVGPVPLAGGTGAAQNLFGRPLAFALSIFAIALLGSAAVRLASPDAHGASDRTTTTLAIAVVLLAAAGLYQLVLGLSAAGTVAPAQLPLTLAFALVLLAAVRHEPQARRRMAKAAALAERHRVARDLHDRLAQDLTFIATHGPALSEEMGDDHPLVMAARRAVAISRSTITELSDPAGATAAEALEAVAQELRDQFDVAVAVNVVLDTDLEPRGREHVTRITREAIANAARHGGARNVSVSLKRLELAVVLRVVDDGRGLAGADGAATREGFGLNSMRERAAALGGYLSIHQPRHGGTELEVVFR